MSNRLAVLAADIRAAHEEIGSACLNSAERAVDVGRWLTEAKADESIPRGGWERWVEQDAGVPQSTAQRYIQIYNAVAEGRLSIGDIAKAGQMGALKAAKSREARRKMKADPAAGPGNCTLLLRDVADLVECEPDTVDWLITDPPYPRDYLSVYDDLARGAAHVLRPGGGLLCMVGQTWLPDVIAALGNHLQYHWMLAYLTPGGQAVQIFPRRVNAFWKPVLLFSKGELAGDAWFGDVARSNTNDNDKEHHHWGQSESGMLDLMRRFVRPGQVVVDPFLGGGATAVVALDLGASFVGSDISEDAINTTKMRLSDADLVN